MVPRVNTANLRRVIEQEVDVPHTLFHTDSASCYNEFDWRAAGHKRVDHAVGEYVRGDVSTNRLRATSPSSSGRSTGPTTTSAASTCPGTWRSSTSATRRAT